MQAGTGVLEQDIEEVILTKEQISARVKDLAAEIAKDYSGKEFLMVGRFEWGNCFLYRSYDGNGCPSSDEFYPCLQLWEGHKKHRQYPV